MNDFKRRTLLKAMGLGAASAGLGLFTPLMRQIAAQEAGADKAPRVLIVVTGNGIQQHNFVPSAWRDVQRDAPDQMRIEAELATGAGEGLEALAHTDSSLDLRQKSVALLGLSSKIAGGSHHADYKALSCSHTRRETIDSVLERVTHDQQERPFGAVRFGAGTGRLKYNFCLRNKDTQLPLVMGAERAYKSMFGALIKDEAYTQRGNLLDFALRDARQAEQAFAGSSIERQKISTYLASLEEIKARRSALERREDDLRALNELYGFSDRSMAGWDAIDSVMSFQDQLKLATAALTGDLTRVAVVTHRVGSDFSQGRYESLRPFYEISESQPLPIRHDVSHGAGGNARYQRVLDELIRAQVGMIAETARVFEQAGILDETIIMYVADNGDEHHSNAQNWPALLIGGGALGVNTGGRTIMYPRYGRRREQGNRRLSNLCNTLLHAAGCELRDPEQGSLFLRDHFGGEPDRYDEGESGPLEELWS